MKILCIYLFLSLAFSSFANDFDAADSGAKSDRTLASSVNDYTYWKRWEFDYQTYCSDTYTNMLVNEGYYVNPIGADPSPFKGILYNYDGHAKYIEIDENGSRILRSEYVCFNPPFDEYHNFAAAVALQEDRGSDYTMLEINTDATYFIGEEGPKVELHFENGADVSQDINVRLEVLYYSSTGWKVSEQKILTHENVATGGFIKAQLPHPALVKFRASVVPNANGEIPSKSHILSFLSIAVYTQECVPDLANPGLCL
jgi:hypothetical protein